MLLFSFYNDIYKLFINYKVAARGQKFLLHSASWIVELHICIKLECQAIDSWVGLYIGLEWHTKYIWLSQICFHIAVAVHDYIAVAVAT